MQKSIKIIFFLLLWVGITTPIRAQIHEEAPEGPLVTVQLVAEQDAIVPGQPFTVALKQDITPGWHTYWKNPGDTGLATTIQWQSNNDVTIGALQFPTPDRQRMADLVNYGYENTVMILATVTPNATLTAGQEVTLQGKANWLVCKEICIPESASFLLTLPVKESASPSAWSSAFTATRALLPASHTATTTSNLVADSLVLTMSSLPLPVDQLPEEAYFFPEDGLLILHNAPQKMELNGRELKLTIPLNKTRSKPIERITGDIWLRTMTGEQSFQFDAVVSKPDPVITPSSADTASSDVTSTKSLESSNPATSSETQTSLITALIGAMLGGLLLNLMPCVFPVLSLKALGLMQKAHHEDRRHVVMGGFAYLFGVLVSFALLATLLVILKNAGHQIGWGIQLQSPSFVAAMAVLLFFIGYVLSGAVTIGSGLIGVGNAWANKHGLAGSFFTGALAVLVATPCTAPFMGGAVFYGLTQGAGTTFAVLLAMGFGLAFPYVALTLYPAALKWMPRPGIWMEHFKQFLAFPMFAAAIWMVWVLAQQVGATGVLYVLSAMTLIAFGFWIYTTTQNRHVTMWQRIKKILMVLSFAAAIYLIVAQPDHTTQTVASSTASDSSATYQAFTPERLAQLHASGTPVFVNMTAAWCISCLANEKSTLSTDSVQSFFQENKIIYMKGDWTNYDEAITQYLKEFGRSGVPLYVFYPADQTKPPVVLPQLLTPSLVLETLRSNL